MAVHVLTVLAHKEGDQVTSHCLAGSVNTNPVIIRRLLLALKKARLIETRKGAGYGSRLTRSPARINLDQVYRAVEVDQPFAMPARKPNKACPIGNCIQTALAAVFSSAEQALSRELARTTLADLLEATRAACRGGRKGIRTASH